MKNSVSRSAFLPATVPFSVVSFLFLLPRRSFGVLIVMSLFRLLMNTPAQALSLNDGQVHNVTPSQFVDGDISVYNNINPPYNPTTLNLYPGNYGYLGIDVHDTSRATLTDVGITALSLSASDDSFVRVDGATFCGSGIGLAGKASGILSGIGTCEMVSATGDSSLVFKDGYASYLSISGNAHTWLGSVETHTSTFRSTVPVKAQSLSVSDRLYVGVGSLRIIDSLHASHEMFLGDSAVTVLGSFSGNFVTLGSNNSTMTLYGTSFNVPFGKYTAADGLDYISGTYRDGSTGEAYLSWSAPDSVLELKKVPDAPTIFLLGSALIGLAAFRRKFRA